MRIHKLGSALVGVVAVLALTTGSPASEAAAPAQPDSGSPAPGALHSEHVVPGKTGSAVRKELPAEVSRRFYELNFAGHVGSVGVAEDAPSAADATTSALSSWTGKFHASWGVSPTSGTMHGAQATHSVNLSAPVTGDDTVYAPTLDPSYASCIEMTTIYFRSSIWVGAWDWCAAAPGWAKTTVVDSAFLDTYTKKVNGRPSYSVQDIQTNATTNEWTSYLYNYDTHAWEPFFQSANTSKLGSSGGGWDMMEVYTNYDPTTGEGQYCAETKGAVYQTTGLQYQSSYGGGWTAATAANSTVPATVKSSDLGCSDLSYAVLTANSGFSLTNEKNPTGPLSNSAGMCVDNRSGNTTNGNPIQLYWCNDTNSQQWTLNLNGTLTVENKCMAVKGGGTADGTAVELDDCDGSGGGTWQTRADGTIYNPQSGKCLDATANYTTAGTQLQIASCTGAVNQRWNLPT
ncbi:RICIN domain-containing protein [Streptomyces hokutonensis]|uniref:RICIN domain-containing protein n=1 Tax=Streptomyces hokutonensis TaxID=1306990 RepID=UPI000370698F|nr:RICIN domain-containing protein [Streptomyces hokutonensis]